MDQTTTGPVIVNTPPTNSGGTGGKIAIVIIIIILLVGAYYFFASKQDVSTLPDTNSTAGQADDAATLNKELDAAASADINADLDKMDKEFQ